MFLCRNKSKMFPTLLKTPKNTHMQFGGSPTPVGTQRSWNDLATKPLQRLAANYVQQAIFPASIRCQVWLYCLVCVPFPVIVTTTRNYINYQYFLFREAIDFYFFYRLSFLLLFWLICDIYFSWNCHATEVRFDSPSLDGWITAWCDPHVSYLDVVEPRWAFGAAPFRNLAKLD